MIVIFILVVIGLIMNLFVFSNQTDDEFLNMHWITYLLYISSYTSVLSSLLMFLYLIIETL